MTGRNYSGLLDDVEVEVERLDDFNIRVRLVSPDRTAEWVISDDEARHVAAGIVSVL